LIKFDFVGFAVESIAWQGLRLTQVDLIHVQHKDQESKEREEGVGFGSKKLESRFILKICRVSVCESIFVIIVDL